jgi:4'-phosphopantetheinyl transferase
MARNQPMGAATPQGEACVYLVAVPNEPTAADTATLSPEERLRASRFRFQCDRSAFVTTRAALRRRLASELDVRADQVRIISEPTGRPALAHGAGGDLDFNVSHAQSLAVVAVARGRRVGVDVEGQRADRELRALVPDVMGPREREMLRGLRGAAFVRAFYACWTRKEAIVKGIGAGLSYPLAAIDIPEPPPGGVVLLPASGQAGHEEVWTLLTMELPGGFTLSVAVAGTGGSIRIATPGNVSPVSAGRHSIGSAAIVHRVSGGPTDALVGCADPAGGRG